MKILLLDESKKAIPSKRIQRAIKRQLRALSYVDVEVSLDQESDFDIVYVNALNYVTYKKVRKMKSQGKRVIYQANSNEENFRDTFLFSNLIAPFFKRLHIDAYELGNRIVAPTDYAKEVLRSYGIKNEIDIIPNAIDLERFAYDALKVEQFREYFQVDVNQALVVCASRINKRKGILDFFSVARAMPDVRFIWFGDVDTKFLPFSVRNALKDVPHNVILPGYVEGNIYEGALSAADVYFYPSYEDIEVSGVNEAMASSTQVVVRDIPVYRPWLIDKESCYMGDTNEDFVALIRANIIGKLGGTQQAAYKIANQHSFERTGKLMLHSFEKVMEEKK